MHGSVTIFHTTQAWPVVVPMALGLIYAGLAMLDLYPRLRKWLGVATIVAAVELLIALVISRYWLFAVVIPVGGVALLAYAVYCLRRRPQSAGEQKQSAVESHEESAEPQRQSIGLLNRSGGVADVSQASFSERLDRAIDNAGEVDASRARFGVSGEPTEDEGGNRQK